MKGVVSHLGNGQGQLCRLGEEPTLLFSELLSWVEPESRAKIAVILAGPELMWLELVRSTFPSPWNHLQGM